VLLVGSACSSLPKPRPTPTVDSPAPRADTGVGAEPRSAADLLAAARSLLGAPYKQAGHDPRGFDCSGLVAYLFAAVGFQLPRTAAAQAELGNWVALDELEAGDLVFFSRSRAKPHHVGLVVSRTGEPLTMIHASTSKGVVETIVTSSSYWLARLRFGRRILGPR
jgi:cell wall-associated NlpC family hydrolase